MVDSFLAKPVSCISTAHKFCEPSWRCALDYNTQQQECQSSRCTSTIKCSPHNVILQDLCELKFTSEVSAVVHSLSELW